MNPQPKPKPKPVAVADPIRKAQQVADKAAERICRFRVITHDAVSRIVADEILKGGNYVS